MLRRLHKKLLGNTNDDVPRDFDPIVYARLNPDVAAAGCDPTRHYIQYGKNEGRVYRVTEERREVVFSSKHVETIVDQPIPDIDRDLVFTGIFRACRNYTMTPKARIYALYKACLHVQNSDIDGDFVECGVWRGGSSIAAALTFEQTPSPRQRQFYLYDTFEGMSAPTSRDVDIGGHSAQAYIERLGDDGKWAYCAEDAVRKNFEIAGVQKTQCHYIRGLVEQTIPANAPTKISICRLDTDWYESTLHELEHLYPRLQSGGVLIIDDYGHWQGAREATDHFFSQNTRSLLVRIDESARLLIKP